MAGKIHPPETSSNYFPQYLETEKKKEKKKKLAGKNTGFAQNLRFHRMAACDGKPCRDCGNCDQTCTHDDSGVVAADRDVLRPGRRRQAEDEDEHGHDQQHPRHDDGFPLPLLEGACEGTRLGHVSRIVYNYY